MVEYTNTKTGERILVLPNTITEGDGTLSANTLTVDTQIFTYTIPRNTKINYDPANEEHYMFFVLKDGNTTPANIPSIAVITVKKSNNTGERVDVIWKGTYARFSGASIYDREERARFSMPVELKADDLLLVFLNQTTGTAPTDREIATANSTVQFSGTATIYM